VDNAPPKLEQQFSGIAIEPVLLYGIGRSLLCQSVLQLECGNRQTIDEEAEIER
jgi:hypothetical protein